MILPTRYEALSPGVGDKSGDAYFAGYAGLNYYFHGHKLKLMSGVKYSYLDGGPAAGISTAGPGWPACAWRFERGTDLRFLCHA